MPRLVGLLLLLLMACGDAEPRKVRLELVLRGSCPRSTKTYDLTCARSLVIAVVGVNGQRFKSQCTDLNGRFDSLQALIASTDVLAVLEEVKARDAVQIELRAYHGGALQKAPCTELADNDLLLWGISPPIDLTNPDLTQVLVNLECRPECDCLAFDQAPERCPLELPMGICAPPENLACRKLCDSNSSCWDGLLTCEVGTCTIGSDDKCCTPEASGVCSPCDANGQCDSNICVHNLDDLDDPKDPDEWFCAEPCPPLPNVSPCPSRMSCKRLGNGTYERASQ